MMICYRLVTINLLVAILQEILFGVNAEVVPIEIPWSLEQLYTSYGIPFHKDSSQIQFVPAPKQEHHLWPGDEKEQLDLSCWSSLRWLSRPRKEDVYIAPYIRHWYVGQGGMDAMRPVSSFGYTVEKVSGSLLLNVSEILKNKHYVFTCTLSSPWPFVSGLMEAHEIVFHRPETTRLEGADYEVCHRLEVTAFRFLISGFDEEETLNGTTPFYSTQGWCIPSINNPKIWKDQTTEHEQNDRPCQLGYYLKSTDLWSQCQKCPEDYFSNLGTPLPICEPCPRERPTTMGIRGAISSQCTSFRLNTIRSDALSRNVQKYRYRLKNQEHAIQWNPELFRRVGNPDDILDHLRPEGERISAQAEAVKFILDMDVLNFSDAEITLILFVSAGLALYGFCLTAVLFFAMNDSLTWQTEAKFTTQPSTLQRMLLSPFVKFVRLIEACIFLPVRLYDATISKRRRFGLLRRMRDSHISVMTRTVFRETLNVYRQQMMWQQLEDMRRMHRLNVILTELTVNRIIEAAELALLMQSDPEMESDFVSFDLSIRFKSKIPLVFRPYLRIPRHFDPESFLMHPSFWLRMYQFHSVYPAPDYPLVV